MTSRQVAVIAVISLLGSACEPGRLTASRAPDPTYVLDAGQTNDGGVDAGFQTPPLDAGVPDATVRDAGQAPTCDCPPLPAQCTVPTVDTPVFSSDLNMQDALLGLLACADETLNIALYELDWPCVTDAIAARLEQAPGLIINVVIDDDQCPRDESGKLTCALRGLESHARVAIVDDARSRYMHHKFWVVDNRWVWTGSANMTENSFCRDFNDAIILDDVNIVAYYQNHFDDLFIGGQFGPLERTPPAQSGPYTLHFGPQSPLSAAPSWHESLLSSIQGADQSIDFSIFALTRVDVSQAIIAAHARGVTVRGVINHRYATNDAATALKAAGVSVKKDAVHSKLLIVDTATVATGSANWSSNAWTNNEESLWINSATTAAIYRAQFDKVFQGADAL
jgi:phosphatidylserine/phosphatidylglycerophosphate/cardiolipin synthase-like enzyme